MKYFLIMISLMVYSSCLSQSKYVIITNESAVRHLPVNSRISELLESELEQVKQIIDDCVSEYNAGVVKSFGAKGQGNYAHMYKIKRLGKYKIQYVPYINDRGEKEVWINGFCHDFDRDWKNQIISVLDGGNCYFQIRMNLTTKSCFEIGVNGYA